MVTFQWPREELGYSENIDDWMKIQMGNQQPSPETFRNCSLIDLSF